MQNLTSTVAILRQELVKNNEWLLDTEDKSFYLLSSEMTVEASGDSILVWFLDDAGYRSERVLDVSVNNGTVKLDVEPQPDDRGRSLLLIPRKKALELKVSVEVARMELANAIAMNLAQQFRGFRPLRVTLNEHTGRFAEILALKGTRHVAILSDVSGAVTHEGILTKAFTWLRALGNRKKNKVREIWLICDRSTASKLRALTACLKDTEASKLRLFRSASKTKAKNQSGYEYEECTPRKFNSLWSGRLPALRLERELPPSSFTKKMKEIDPQNIDRVFTAKGETLRYKGLPFARTRAMSGREKTWFGLAKNRIPLNRSSIPEFELLIQNLQTYRRSHSPNKQHELYSMAPESWLESMIRRNVKQLDANLILSPIYNQFRAAREKIDLLALRRDGRLVIIELKIAPDRDMVFQAVDYWRKVEAQRKRGLLNKASLFGERTIAERPAIVYLVGPTLGFHNETEFFSDKINENIEINRFDLAEDWRREVTVLRRTALNRKFE